jgi:GT2 family glycosyltransferase
VIVDPGIEPKVLAILPTLAKDLTLLLASIQSIKDSNFRQTLSILIIANDPETEIDPIDGVTVINPGLNLGFNGGLVYGTKIYKSEFIWIIQDDVRVYPNTLSNLHEEILALPKISMLSPRRIDSAGNFPACGGWTDTQGNITGFYSEALREDKEYNVPQKLNWVSSSGSLIRREMWEALGGYDLDLYPLGFGDVDFCDRATAQGYEFSLSDVAIIEHEHLSSSTPSILRDFLSQSTGGIFSKKKKNIWSAPPILPSVHPELLAKIAQRASIMIPQLARFASDHHPYKQSLTTKEIEIETLKNELLQAQLELEAIKRSHIWRISKPYRLLRKHLKQSIHS